MYNIFINMSLPYKIINIQEESNFQPKQFLVLSNCSFMKTNYRVQLQTYVEHE